MEPELHLDAERITALARAPSHEVADHAAIARIVTENEDALFKHIFKRLNDFHLAHDILQQTLRAVWEKRHTFNFELRPLPWLKAIASHKISDHFDAKGAKKRGGGKDEVTVVIIEPNGQPRTGTDSESCISPGLESWQDASNNERERALHLAIRSLPQREQEILRQRYWEKISVAEIAEFCNLSEAAITGILNRTRNTLRKQLNAMGFSDPSSEVNRHLKGDIM